MYITINQKPERNVTVTFEDILCGKYADYDFDKKSIPGGTLTRTFDQIPDHLRSKYSAEELVSALRQFNEKFSDLRLKPRQELYYTFKIPKKSGGFRTISAPEEELKAAQYVLKNLFEQMFGASHHTAAFAYVKERSHMNAATKHQANASNWFLKTDFSDFFGSITMEFVMNMLAQIYPFSMICASKEGSEELRTALDLCFLHGGLPQGTPISPMLTNLIMIPIDHRLFGILSRHRYVYTRYADDITISCVQSFDPQRIVAMIDAVLKEFNAPLTIKDEKTHYGSRKGNNWMLGLMLNAENQITVGYKKKKVFKAAVSNFILDSIHHIQWEVGDVQHLAGLLSYYRSIEKEYFDHVIDQANKKYHVDFEKMLKNKLFASHMQHD